jgi:tRNA (guanosine-2'-O-)-methyltransferase
LATALTPETEEALLEFLLGFVTPDRRERMLEVVELRTDYVRLVLEDIYQPHNASAVIRSCECFGINTLHVIENKYRYTLHRDVAMGASKWIHLRRPNEPEVDNRTACLNELRTAGYRIVATSLHPDSVPIEEIPLDKPLALCFGTEEKGLSKSLLAAADMTTRIPMYGFTQSFNISVSAALCLSSLRRRLEKTAIPLQLSPAQRRQTLLTWARRSIPKIDRVEKAFFRAQGP